jgi:DnaK suppressor protein
MDRMNVQQMRRLKTLLEVRQHELRLSIEHHQQFARRVEPEPDVLDQAASVSEQESLLQRRNQEQHLLQATDSALGRIRAGTYGKCLSCGQQIAGRRLESRTVDAVLHSLRRGLRAVTRWISDPI